MPGRFSATHAAAAPATAGGASPATARRAARATARRASRAARAAALAAAVVCAAAIGAGAAPRPAAAAVAPHRSFERLVTGNGWAVASYDRATRRLDTFLEHPFRFFAPRDDPPDLCFGADESRDLLYDTYFGVRAGAGAAARGDWLPDAPLDDAGYLPGTGVVYTDQHVGDGRALRVRTWSFMPMGLDAPALVMVARIDNEGAAALPVSPYVLFNFHLGDAAGGREPSADAEEVAPDPTRPALYEYSAQSAGTIAYVALAPLAHRTAATGAASAYQALLAAADLDDAAATAGPTFDVAPGFQGPQTTLAPGAAATFAAGVVWALDEDAGPDVDALVAWAAGRAPEDLVAGETADWAAWQTAPPAELDPDAADLWLQSAAFLRMAQVRETGGGFGQILASLPPGLGDPAAQWNIAWVRDMAYATVALARSGHLAEARDALRFQVLAGPGRHVAEVGMPYRISVTRYFGNGAEESDCNASGPNIEFDGFGLFLWALGEYLRAGGDVEEARTWWPTVRDEVADVLVSLVDADGTLRADSSIWEVHWNGMERRFTYSSLAAARGLCEAAGVAEALGEAADAARFAAAGAGVRDAVVATRTDPRGALGQSLEDLVAGYGYVDAAAVEAVGWGIVDPGARVAAATIAAVTDNLTTASGLGFMRNDDGAWYDSQEWVFVGLRLEPALRATGDAALAARADALRAWLEGQALANDFHFSELHDPADGDYEGSIPMVGFGAGAYLIARSGGGVLGPACGAYAAEPAAPPADAGV
ncbi:MAG TPA: glycoside hydrolase family 15 protein, partial [Myxococcota bacterium]|nr:glycoside hydrolase family 15 protein [Myxococcota bacterium]